LCATKNRSIFFLSPLCATSSAKSIILINYEASHYVISASLFAAYLLGRNIFLSTPLLKHP
jgi:hypothetical protein